MNPISHVGPPMTEQPTKNVASPHVDRVSAISPDSHRQHTQVVLPKHIDKKHNKSGEHAEEVESIRKSGKTTARLISEQFSLPAPKVGKQLRDPSKTLLLMTVNEQSGLVANSLRISSAMHAYQRFQEIIAIGADMPNGGPGPLESGGEELSTNDESDEAPDDRVESHETGDSLDMQA